MRIEFMLKISYDVDNIEYDARFISEVLHQRTKRCRNHFHAVLSKSNNFNNYFIFIH